MLGFVESKATLTLSIVFIHVYLYTVTRELPTGRRIGDLTNGTGPGYK